MDQSGRVTQAFNVEVFPGSNEGSFDGYTNGSGPGSDAHVDFIRADSEKEDEVNSSADKRDSDSNTVEEINKDVDEDAMPTLEHDGYVLQILCTAIYFLMHIQIFDHPSTISSYCLWTQRQTWTAQSGR